MQEFENHFAVELLFGGVAHVVAFRLQVIFTKDGDAFHTVGHRVITSSQLVVAHEEGAHPNGGGQGVLLGVGGVMHFQDLGKVAEEADGGEEQRVILALAEVLHDLHGLHRVTTSDGVLQLKHVEVL